MRITKVILSPNFVSARKAKFAQNLQIALFVQFHNSTDYFVQCSQVQLCQGDQLGQDAAEKLMDNKSPTWYQSVQRHISATHCSDERLLGVAPVRT